MQRDLLRITGRGEQILPKATKTKTAPGQQCRRSDAKLRRLRQGRDGTAAQARKAEWELGGTEGPSKKEPSLTYPKPQRREAAQRHRSPVGEGGKGLAVWNCRRLGGTTVAEILAASLEIAQILKNGFCSENPVGNMCLPKSEVEVRATWRCLQLALQSLQEDCSSHNCRLRPVCSSRGPEGTRRKACSTSRTTKTVTRRTLALLTQLAEANLPLSTVRSTKGPCVWAGEDQFNQLKSLTFKTPSTSAKGGQGTSASATKARIQGAARRQGQGTSKTVNGSKRWLQPTNL